MTEESRHLRERREATVIEHIDAENRHDIDAALATFDRPRYQVNGAESDGEAAVRDLLGDLMTGLPDLEAEIRKLHHADDAVIVEGLIRGTHDGEWAGVPATGRPVQLPAACIFEFENDRLVCEKVFYDVASVLTQIGVLPEPAASMGAVE